MKSGRRGIILATVMIVGAATLWLVVALTAQASIDTSDVDAGVDQIQRQSAMRSALLLVASQLQDQRDTLRSGSVPTLKSQWSLWQTGPQMTVARLIEQWDGRLLRPEAAGIDLNLATRDMLAELPGMSEASADAIIAYREQATIGDTRELADLAALSETVLHGAEGLLNHVTVHAHEPNVQSSGDLRINLNVEWSDTLGERIQERYGDDEAEILKQVLNSEPLENDAALVALMQQYDLHPEDWDEPLDGLTTESGVFRRGRVDINLASQEVLQALPGVTAELAAAAVEYRQGIDEEQRLHSSWPFSKKVWPESIAVDVLPLTTVGTWTWRVRLAVGEVPADDLEASMQHFAMYEVVFDLAGTQPIISSIRDVSLEAYAMQWEPDEKLAAQPADERVAASIIETNDGVDDDQLNDTPDSDQPAAEEAVASPFPTAEGSEQADLQAAEPTQTDPRLGRWRP